MSKIDVQELLEEIRKKVITVNEAEQRSLQTMERVTREVLKNSQKNTKSTKSQILFSLAACCYFCAFFSLLINFRIGLTFPGLIYFVGFMIPAYLISKILMR